MRRLPMTAAALLAFLSGSAYAAPAVRAQPAVPVAVARPADPVYSAPSGAWSQFQSDLTSAGGLADGQGVTVALLSDGVDTASSGLGGKVTEGPDYVGKPTLPETHFAGTIEASVLLGVPGTVTGALPNARILGLRVEPGWNESDDNRFFTTIGYGASESAILSKAIRYAVGHGARVIDIDPEIDNSGYFGGADTDLMSAVSAANARGAVIVAGQYNNGSGTGHYLFPAGLPGVIGVSSVMLPGGVNPADLPLHPSSPDRSARNDSVLISGPGDWIQAVPDGWGPGGTGTATVYVTAAVAMIKQRYPDLSPALVERALAMSARDKPSGGYSTQVGFGILDPYDAVLDAGKLTRVRVSAQPGPGIQDATTHFGAVPGVVDALPSALPQEIGSVAGIVVGAVLLVLAVIIAIRGRRNRRERRGPRPDNAEPEGPRSATQPAPPAFPDSGDWR